MFLREVLDHAFTDLSQSTDCLDGRLARFRDVLISDTTVVTLYQSLIESFPGYGDEHAGAKLHVVESVSTGLPTQFSITDFTALTTRVACCEQPWVVLVERVLLERGALLISHQRWRGTICM